MNYEKVKVEESAKNFVEATDKGIDFVMKKGGTVGMLMGMDADTLEAIQIAMKVVSGVKELVLKQAEAMDQLTDMISDMRKKIDYMDDKMDKLGKKKITE